MNKKVSVIVPVYNLESYIERCLDSLLMQDYDDLEIILVNDGSTDKSLEIIEKYAQQSESIIVINQKNSGVSSARNAGIEKLLDSLLPLLMETIMLTQILFRH